MTGIITATHKKSTLELFCYSVQKLRNDTGIPITCICVGEKEDASICRQYDIIHVYHSNDYVSDKFNIAMREIKSYKPDNVLVLGSDNIISTDTLRWYMDHKDYDLISTQTLYVYNTPTKELIKLWLKNIGAGRMYHKRVLDKYDWTIWPDGLKRNLDQNSLRYVNESIKTSLAMHNGFLLDIKTNNNITPWDKLASRPEAVKQNTDTLKHYLSDKQVELLHLC